MASRKHCSPQFHSRRATVSGRQGIETGVYTLADFPVGDRSPERGLRRPDRPRAALPLSRPLVIPGVRGPLFAASPLSRTGEWRAASLHCLHRSTSDLGAGRPCRRTWRAPRARPGNKCDGALIALQVAHTRRIAHTSAADSPASRAPRTMNTGGNERCRGAPSSSRFWVSVPVHPCRILCDAAFFFFEQFRKGVVVPASLVSSF